MNLRKIFKISIIIFFSIIIIIGIALIAMVTFVNPNNYKPLIIQMVEDDTGRKLSLAGNISWKLWPNIGLHIEKVSLSNPKGFKDTNLIAVNSVDLSVQLLPLFHHSVIINNLTINGANLALLKIGNSNNWTFSNKNEASSTEESSPNKPLKLTLKSLKIANSTVTYTDSNTKTNYAIKDFDLLLQSSYNGQILFDQQQHIVNLKNVEFNFSDIVEGDTNLVLDNSSAAKYNGDINIKQFSLPKLLAKINYPIKSIQGKSLFDAISFKSNFALNQTTLKLTDTQINLDNNLKMDVTTTINNFNSSPQYSGTVNLPEFSLNKVLDGLNIDKANRANNQLFDKFSLNSAFNGNKENLELSHLAFNFSTICKGIVNLKLKNFSSPIYSGNVNLPTFSLNQTMQKYGAKPIKINHPEILNRVAVQSSFNGMENSINLNNILARISDSTIKGNVDIKSITPLKLNHNLTIDKIDLADIKEVSGYKIPLTGIQSSGNMSIDHDQNLATLNANQNINISNVTILGFNLDNLIKQLDQVINNTIKVVSVDNLQQINHSIQVVTIIKNMQTIIEKAKAKSQRDYSQKTNLGSLAVNTSIKNGIANPTTFKLNGPSIKSNGQGLVNLVNDTLNYKVTTQLVLKEQNSILNNIVFPYTMHGKTDDIQGSLDWISIQKQLLEYLIKNIGTQTKALLKNQLNNAVGSQIQNAPTNVKQGVTNVINNIFK
ncbi:MAG: AsmA family protein [Burkholderiales bacterium]|nr:AsmA family protein [Burkholderiales bacterium]